VQSAQEGLLVSLEHYGGDWCQFLALWGIAAPGKQFSLVIKVKLENDSKSTHSLNGYQL
jgi:hypothetical protein